MATKKLYIGSVGPFLYDDTDLVDDVDGDFSGETYKGILTDGDVLSANAPYAPDLSSDKWVKTGGSADLKSVDIICNDNKVVCISNEVVTL